jgi:hypothetical protein
MNNTEFHIKTLSIPKHLISDRTRRSVFLEINADTLETVQQLIKFCCLAMLTSITVRTVESNASQKVSIIFSALIDKWDEGGIECMRIIDIERGSQQAIGSWISILH